MLFNTQAYAWFLGVVFVLTWVLATPQRRIWVPWVGLAAFALFNSPLLPASEAPLGVAAGLLVAIAAAVTWSLDRWSPSRRRAALLSASVLNSAVFCLLAEMAFKLDPLTLTAVELGLLPPTPETTRLSGRILAAIEASAGLRSALALVFIAAVAAVSFAKNPRLLLLLLASYAFYAHWDYRFLPLIFGSSTIDYWLGLKIGRTEDPTARKRWLALTVVVNLGVLAFFKYFNFGIDSARAALSALGLSAPDWTLEIALPVGISFFTFESMSYVIDVYRKDLPPHESYLEYLSFVAFFPHLVAGPIVRPKDLLPQLRQKPRFDAAIASEGLFLICTGLLKKTAIGDYLAVNLVDRVFDAPTQYSSLECYAATVGYALQIYCDFSGYTDIAIGSALLLGVRFPMNFNAPYQARSVQDFWRRWHISLSTWLRDYLYIPLGGNRKGKVRTYVNLLVTMLLGGLWHGANWTFIVWGGLHGAALGLERAFTQRRPASPARWRHGLGVFATFHFVCFAWIFFRSATFQQAETMLTQLSLLTTHHANLPAKVLLVLAIGIVTHLFPQGLFERLKVGFGTLPAPLQALTLLTAAFCLKVMASAQAVPFVYFQF